MSGRDDDGGELDASRTWVEDPTTATVPREPAAHRYRDEGVLGSGGMSEVRRVHDGLLDRTVAVKRLKEGDRDSSVARTRFLREARITAALQHPGVVPVLDLGWDDHGAVWFSMPVVEGRTLDDVLRALHAGEPEWPVRRVVDVLLRVTQAVAYAHHEGIVHRDVKPANVMIGRFGEVRLLDWGIATRASVHSSLARRHVATGTPSYMSPEQASGASPTPAADVYALGAVMYELLTGGPPFDGDRTTVLTRVRTEAPPPPNTTLPGTDARLVALCTAAMARDADLRPTASELARRLRAWLDNADAREQALLCVQRYHAARRAMTQALALAAEERDHAAALLADVPPYAPEEDKLAAWSHQDAAELHEADATEARLTAEGHISAAFSLVPNLPEAREALAAQHAEEHAAAEARGDVSGAHEAEQRLRAQLAHLPLAHPRRVGLADYLRGDGALSLGADRDGVRATLSRFVEHHRRLVPGEATEVALPLVDHPLPMGSWLVVLTSDDGVEVRYPVHIRRQAHWDAGTVHIPAPGEVHDDACYVPAGPFLCGGAPEVENSLPGAWVELPGFAMMRFPVTNAQFIAFLEDLVRQGREDEALALAPRERAGTAAEVGPLIYAYDAGAGTFSLQPDVDGDLWEPDWPVVNIATPSALAYAEWLSEQTGHAWRLPTELEWEKAARGVDGRALPWGDHPDASWCACKESHGSTPICQPVASFPVDESVYGLRHMAGNVRERTSTRYAPRHMHQDRVLLVERGGNWLTPLDKLHVCMRSWAPQTHRFTLLGFRLAHDP